METTVNKLLVILRSRYPDPQIELKNWKDPFQLMVCVILSAQSTDISVNKVSEELLLKYPTIEKLAEAEVGNVSKIIKSINYYNTKALRIIKAAQYLKTSNNSVLPTSIKEWTKVPGIGNKSANVIMITAQNLKAEGIVVDTHVTRITTRLNLTINNNASKIEDDLKEKFQQKDWAYISKALVLFGRYICKAKSPKCEECTLKSTCNYYRNRPN